MKSIEELINQLECYPVSPSTLPMSVMIVKEEDINDAINYLKEYADRQENLDQFETYQFVHKYPLTWEELKEMVGKPVWMERPEWKEWLLVSEIDNDKCEMYLRDKWGNGVLVNGRNVGYWRAYRKERS